MIDTPQIKLTSHVSLSSNGRGGIWLPIILGTIAIGILLSGIFSGATGLFGDSGTVTFGSKVHEGGRDLARLFVFSILLLLALRFFSWKIQKSYGNITLAALRCLAIVACIEAVRVAQIPHGLMRVVLLISTQYVLFGILIFGLFTVTIRESVLFVTGCTVAAGLLWIGAYVGIWIT